MKYHNITTNGRLLTVLFSLLFLSQTMWAAIRMPRLFSDGMVLQRGMEVPVWGWSEPGQTVSVCLLTAEGKAKKKHVTYTATADATGKWQLRLPAMRPSGPLALQVSSGDVKVVINDVLTEPTVARLYNTVAGDTTWVLPPMRRMVNANDTVNIVTGLPKGYSLGCVYAQAGTVTANDRVLIYTAPAEQVADLLAGFGPVRKNLDYIRTETAFRQSAGVFAAMNGNTLSVLL